jgi:cytochrome c5
MRTHFLVSLVLFTLPVLATASGEAIYEKHCAQCHSSGDVYVPQIGSLEQWRFRANYGAKSLLYSVRNGHNLMPGHGDQLKDDDMAMAIDYLVSRSGGWPQK